LNASRLTWLLSYAYLAYLFVSEIPQVNGSPVFSIQLESVLLIFLYFASSYLDWGARRATKYLIGTSLASYIIEFAGVRTGYPFGNYSYTPALSPFVGPVPLFIPLMWCALGYFCLRASGLSVVVPALLMMFLDISLDPIFSRDLWHWQATPGPQYFGVPLLNFVGWLISALLLFTIFRLAVVETRRSPARTVLFSKGNMMAAGFYFLFGMTTVLSDLNAGLLGAAMVSVFLYAISGALLWKLNSNK